MRSLTEAARASAGAALANLDDAVEAALAAADQDPTGLVAGHVVGTLRRAVGAGGEDVVAAGAWAASKGSTTIHATDGLVLVSGQVILAVGTADREELAHLVARRPATALGEVELWLTDPDHPLRLRAIQAVGLRIEQVAALVVAALRRASVGVHVENYFLGRQRIDGAWHVFPAVVRTDVHYGDEAPPLPELAQVVLAWRAGGPVPQPWAAWVEGRPADQRAKAWQALEDARAG